MQVETVVESNEIPDRGEVLRKGFRMGDWIVRPIEGMIDGRLGTRHLQPKSMDVLLCLACSPNHIVERDALVEEVWGHAAVTDEPLTRCIHEIRRELNDTRDHPTYIQTIPKRGYRLIAPGRSGGRYCRSPMQSGIRRSIPAEEGSPAVFCRGDWPFK